MKQFVKALDKGGECFRYLCTKFPRLTYENIKAGIFDGAQMRLLLKDATFISIMKKELNALKTIWETKHYQNSANFLKAYCKLFITYAAP